MFVAKVGKRRRDGEMERWRDGEMERWRDGEMERWRDGEKVGSNFAPKMSAQVRESTPPVTIYLHS
jgi:hypothetical protein